jgi:peptide subunit release factor 1 (eRF1)
MFNQAALQELLTFEAGEKQVVSLYLNADVGQMPVDAIKLKVRNLLREATNGAAGNHEAVERFLNNTYDWSKPGLAIFSCQEQDFFRAYPAAVAFNDRIRVSHKPYVKPLAHLLDHYARYGVVLVDRVGARFFLFDLGELIETGGAMGEEIRKVKRGRGSSATGMRGGMGGGRHEEEMADRNLRELAQEATDYFHNRGIRRLFLGGTTETLAQFRDLLPKQLQSCIAGTFAMDKYASENEVRDRALELLHETNERREQQLVDSLITAAAKQANAVTGIDDTLQAVVEGRVQTLVLSDGLRLPGFAKPEVNFIVANPARTHYDLSELQEIDDVVEEAVALTMSQGGHVEVVANNPHLEDAGRIGALLRY